MIIKFEKGTLYGERETLERINILMKILKKHVGFGYLPDELEDAYNNLIFWEPAE